MSHAYQTIPANKKKLLSLCAGRFRSLSFSASPALSEVMQETSSSHRLFMDQITVFSCGTVTYLDTMTANTAHSVTDRFVQAVRALPYRGNGIYSVNDDHLYHNFIEEWGTVSVYIAVRMIVLIFSKVRPLYHYLSKVANDLANNHVRTEHLHHIIKTGYPVMNADGSFEIFY